MTRPETDDETVSLTIKVPESWRTYWQIEAKKRRTTMRQAIIDALTKEFGLPEDERKKAN